MLEDKVNPVVTELSHPAFDHVTIAKSEGFIQLFTCRGRQMIHIRYWGDADLTDKLDIQASEAALYSVILHQPPAKTAVLKNQFPDHHKYSP